MARYPKNQREHQESKRYQDNDARARENRSSAWALLMVGGAGLLLVALGIAGILPLQFGNPYLFYGVMMAVFFLFVVMGVLSVQNARIFAEKAEADNTLLDTVEKWCGETLRAEEIDAVLDAKEGGRAESDFGDGRAVSEESADEYFRRVEYLKERINRQFMNLDESLLDHFIDEYLYDTIFKKGED